MKERNGNVKKTELLEYRVSNSIVDLFIFLVTDISIICSRNAVVIVFKTRIRASWIMLIWTSKKNIDCMEMSVIK